VKLGPFLIAVERDVGGVDIEHQFGGWCRATGDELFDQHAVQGHDVGSAGAAFHAAQGRAAAQRNAGADCRLHQRIAAQSGMVVQVFVAAGQAVQALRNEVAQFMHDTIGIARVKEGSGHGIRQADLAIHFPQEHQAAVGTERATLKIGLDDAAFQTPKCQ
jgi:hypothetical protein